MCYLAKIAPNQIKNHTLAKGLSPQFSTEEEWELAAGHMPKGADFNYGISDAIRPVDAFAQTKGASGGIDFWGNCWEWTSTKRNGKNVVKGGAYDSKRTDCRTEAKNTAKAASNGYPNVTIRLVRENRNANQQGDDN